MEFTGMKRREGRRRFLRLAGLTAAGAAVASILPVDVLASTPPLCLKNIHTGESLRRAFRTAAGYDAQALRSIDKLLRDHRTGDIHPIDPALLDFLEAIACKLGATPEFQVISGYRSPATNTALRQKGRQVARKSFHLLGQAVDIRMPGIEITRLHRAALDLELGGVGLYRGQDFIHVDTGPVRSW